MSRYGGRAIFIGNLPDNVRERDLEEAFAKFGRIRMIDIKTPPRPPAFAFLEYDDPRDAQEAARRRNGMEFGGLRIRVEVARGGEPQPAIRTAYVPPRNSAGYRVLVKNLPQSASWQDLKDHFRRVVKPLYTETYRDRSDGLIGVVEFENFEDLRLAIRKLDDTEFKNPFDKGSYIRLVDDSDHVRREDRGRGRDGDRGRDDRRDSDRGRGRDVRRSPSERSKSRSPASRSRSRGSRSASPKGRHSRSHSPRDAAARKSRSPVRVQRSRSRSASRSASPAHKERDASADRREGKGRSPASPRRREQDDD